MLSTKGDVVVTESVASTELVSRDFIINFFKSRDLLITPNAVDKIFANNDATSLCNKCVSNFTGFVVDENRVDDCLNGTTQPTIEVNPGLVVRVDYKPIAKDVAARVRMRDDFDVTGKSRCTGTVEDFVGFFRDRFRRMSTILKGHISKEAPVKISALKAQGRKQTRFIGMVYEKKPTKNGHLIIDVEDEEDSVKVLVTKDSPTMLKCDDLVVDDVVAFEGMQGEGLFIASDVIWPGMPVSARRNVCDEDITLACISDIHIGSRFFMRENFEKFIGFLNGKGSPAEQAYASKIKYITIAGDLVDGIGVYPSQEKELVTKDIYKQYEIFSDYMKQIPEYIQVFIAPGNHDAVRSALPQPRLDDSFTKDLKTYSNVHFVGNPSLHELHDVKVLLYHGNTMYSLMSAIPKLRGANMNPEKAGVEMLRRRQLAPIYGEDPLAPEHRDYMVVEDAPDVFHFGDIHRNGYTQYHGSMIINSGCWQSMTDYQVKLGHHPTPAQLPLYNLKTGALKVVSFTEEIT